MLSLVYLTEARFLQHVQTQAATIDQYAVESGLDNTDIDKIKTMAIAFEWLIEMCNLAQQFTGTAFKIKQQFFSTDTTQVIGQFMNAPDLKNPPEIISGAVRISRKIDQRMLDSKTMTVAAKIALDLIGDSSTSPTPDSVKPNIAAFPASIGYHFAAVVSNRGKSDMSDIYVSRAGTTKWQKIESGTGKSINVIVTPEPDEAGKSIQLQTRVQLRKNNADYGQISEPVFVTVNP